MSADWAKAPPMWSNIILDVSRRMFVDEMSILICGLRVKQVAPSPTPRPPPSVCGPQLINWRFKHTKRLIPHKQEGILHRAAFEFKLQCQFFPEYLSWWPVLQLLKLASIHNHLSQFLTIYLSICRHVLLILFIWRTPATQSSQLFGELRCEEMNEWPCRKSWAWWLHHGQS